MAGRYAVSCTEPIRDLRVHRAPPADAPTGRAAELLAMVDVERADQQVRERVHAAMAVVQQTVAGLPAAVAERLDAIESLVVDLGLGLAEQVVGEVAAAGRADVTAAVRRCLDEVVDAQRTPQAEVRMHPEDLAEALPWLEAECATRVGAVSFVPEPALARGTVRVHSEAGHLVYDPAEVLQRVLAAARSAVADALARDEAT